MRKLMMLLSMLAVVTMIAAAPVMAQDPKAEAKAAKANAKAAEKAAKADAKAAEKATKAEGGKKEKMKEMPKTGGLPVDPTVAGLGAGALLVGGGLVVRRVTKR